MRNLLYATKDIKKGGEKMTKEKFLLIILCLCFVLCIPTIASATDGVSVTRELYANNGSMRFYFSGLTLDTTHEYEFGLTRTSAAEVENWHLITTYTESTATVDISIETADLKEVINVVDTGYITIKDKTADSIVLQPFTVDLKIPFLRITNFTVVQNGAEFHTGLAQEEQFNVGLRNAGNSEAYFQYQKITDQNIIDQYKKIKEENGNYLELESMLTTTVPTSNWSNWRYWNGYGQTSGHGYPASTITVPDTGLYYLWVYFAGDGIKDMYGYVLVDNLPTDEIALESISLPQTETVELGDTLQLSPTLTPANTTDTTLTWSSSDTSVATVDSSGKVTPLKVGSTIITVTSQDGSKRATCTVTVTNVSDDDNNNDDNSNQGNNNNSNDNNNSNNNSNNSNNNNTSNNNGGSNNGGSSTNNGDSTTAPGTLPQTGESAIIALVIVSISILGIVTFIKFRKLRGI